MSNSRFSRRDPNRRDPNRRDPESARVGLAGRGKKLARSFYTRDTVTVARRLLGKHLVHLRGGKLQVGRIVETEAYQGPEDLAAHSARGRRTARTEVMFGPPGYAYVYLIYGMHHCFNVVTRREGIPHAVLVRALEPVSGIEEDTRGPGLLCRTLGISRLHNRTDLTGDVLWIETPKRARRPVISSSPRIGVAYAGAWADEPLRFFDSTSTHVSGRRKMRQQ